MNYGLTQQQIKALHIIEEEWRMTNKRYRKLFSICRRSAASDLTALAEKNWSTDGRTRAVENNS